MKYREFGKTGLKVSALGFGTMRLPLLEDGVTVDEKEAVRIIRHAIDSGVNYVDTAYPYHQGTSEIVVGKALRDGYRDKVFLADKSPIWKLEKESDFDSILEEQLQKLQTDHIDFYLLHALNKERFEKIKNLHLIDHMLEARKAGKIRYLGFSFHDDLEVFKQIVDYTDQWDFCQIQYNYINRAYQAGDEGLTYAAEKGLAVIIMEPLLGGRLANLSEHVAEVFSQDKTSVEHALDFLWDKKEVSLLLSGMGTEQQVEDNLVYAGRSAVGMLTAEEKKQYEKAKEIYDKMSMVDCTGCAYCMPCPFGLNIPELFKAYNTYGPEGKDGMKREYEKQQVRSDSCRSCHRCEKVCPQNIKISEQMKKIAEMMK